MSRPERQRVIDDLTAVCNSLGKLDENDGTYMKDRDCKACLKEIVRYLNNDPNPFVARTLIGELNIIKSDLIPLLVQYCDYNDGDRDLFTIILRLSTNLTSSALLLFENEEVPIDPDQQKTYYKLMKILYGYKEAFASNDKIWASLNIHLRHNLDDEITFERLIILIRNVLHIPVDSTGDMGIHSDFDAHDMCLYRMDKSGMLDTIIKIASETEKGAEYCFHLIEIIYLMLRDQNPETLATARPYSLKRKLDEDDADKKRYAELSARAKRDREFKNKAERVAQIRFRTSTFVVQNYRSLTNEPLVVHNPVEKREKIDLNKGKTQLRKAKNRRALSSETSMIISDRNTKLSRVSFSLRSFCKLFVEKVYNNYMQQIKHNLIQKKTQENDESYYLWAIQFFTKFTRHINLDMANISETLSTSTLHYIQILISSYQDKLKIEKKKFKDISKRLHLAIRAYREILYLIKSIDAGSDFAPIADKILKNIFTETEYSTLVLTLLQQYQEQRHSLHYLEDLITTNDIFSQLLEEYANSHAAVVVEEEEEEPPDESDEEQPDKSVGKQLDESVDELFDKLIDEPVGEPVEKQADEPVVDLVDKPIEDLVEEPHDKTLEEPIEKPAQKSADKSVEKPNKKPVKKPTKKPKKNKKRKTKDKVDFRTAHFMSRYCCPDVINAYMMKLKNFRNNDDFLNLAILKFLERIVYDCKQDVILFQASIFKCLIEIMEYHDSLPGHDRFKELAKHLMATFGEMANKRRWMFQELLFWKKVSDCVDIEHAMNPPAIPIERPLVDMEADIPDDNVEEGLPVDSLADLKAELFGSSDDDWDPLPEEPLPENPPESQSQPKETIEDLLAELGDDPPASAPLPLNADSISSPSDADSTPSPAAAAPIPSLPESEASSPSPLPSLPPSPEVCELD